MANGWTLCTAADLWLGVRDEIAERAGALQRSAGEVERVATANAVHVGFEGDVRHLVQLAALQAAAKIIDPDPGAFPEHQSLIVNRRRMEDIDEGKAVYRRARNPAGENLVELRLRLRTVHRTGGRARPQKTRRHHHCQKYSHAAPPADAEGMSRS